MTTRTAAPAARIDRHKTKPKAVRMPDGLLARVETAVEGSAETVNAFIVAAIEERLERREDGSTTRTRKARADTAPPVVLRQPAPVAVRAHAPTCKCGICRPGKG